MSFLYCLSLRDYSRHLANICSWLLCSAVWPCFHHLSSLPPSLNVGIPGTSVWNNREADGSPPDKSARSPGIKEQGNTLTEASGRRMMAKKYGNILKITCSSFSYNNRFWYFCLHSIWWLVSTSSSLLSMNILTPKLVKVACWTHWLTEQKAAGASKTITGVSFPPFIPFMVFSTVCLTTNSICGIWLRYLLYLKLL